MTLRKGQRLWKTAKKLIPGGNQLLSKRAEMFLPEHWPSYYKKASGVEIWDLDGRHYYDMSIMGIGACVLGYANKAVDVAVQRAVRAGTMSTLNCPEEVELARQLLRLHPWAGMVRYARTGGEACAIAVRIARAATGKDKVLFCGYHGWSDWYLSSNLSDSKNLDGQLLPGLRPLGVPRALKGTALPFHYGDVGALEKLIKENRGKVGAIIMEVQRHSPVDVSFLKRARRLASEAGAVLIFDEVTSGFRLRAGGAHLLYGVEPDIVVLGKAMGNGYPIAAIVGRKRVMEKAQDTFISSTYWTERIGFAAALAVISEFGKRDIGKQLSASGDHLGRGLEKLFKRHKLDINVAGMKPMLILEIKEKEPLLLKTVFTQEMLKKGFLAGTSIYLSTAHSRKILDRYLADADSVFGQIAKAMRRGKLRRMLQGPICHSGFRRLA